MDFETYALQQGVVIRGYLPDDGKLRRFATTDKPHRRNGWAILYAGGKAGMVGDWLTGEKHLWTAKGHTVTDGERKGYAEHYARIREERQEKAAKLARRLWEGASVTGGSVYFAMKCVGIYSVRFRGDQIVIPIYDADSKLISLQFIAADGSKRFLPGGRIKGGRCIIPGKDKVVVAEGYATAASIHEATGYTVVIAFNASNIPLVADGADMIAADHDAHGIGERYAKESGKPYVMPASVGHDFNDAMRAGENIASYFQPTLPAFKFKQYYNDHTPIPDDLIEPRVLTPGGLLVFGGAPKVGKSDFLINLLAHSAAGVATMGMQPTRPLRIYYLQAEIGYHYLRERIQALELHPSMLAALEQNLVITPQCRVLLDANGVEKVVNSITQHFPHGVDIIAIDPLRNVFDGDSENDNAAMLRFLQERVEAVRQRTSPEAGIIIAHHTRKITSDALMEDPFQGLSGASALRGFYTTGIIMYRPDEAMSERVLTFELRNGAKIPDKYIDKIDGRWTPLEKESSRLVNKHHGAKLDAERMRKRDVIIDILEAEAVTGKTYTITTFAQRFEGKQDLGGYGTIYQRIQVLATQGYIKFYKDPKSHHRNSGILVTEDFILYSEGVDKKLLPTHYKSSQTGELVEERYPEKWIYS